jgi:uncharacterized protein YrrD
MRLGKDFLNKPIISITDGRLLGNVKDIYLDVNLETIAGLHLGSEGLQGLLSRKFFVISGDQVQVFGVDAVLVKGSDVVVEEEEAVEAVNWIRRDKLQGRKVDTPGGTRVGVVGDVVFEDDGVQVVGFKLSRVAVEGPIAASGAVDKSAMIDAGSQDNPMTIDLSKAEQQSLNLKAE